MCYWVYAMDQFAINRIKAKRQKSEKIDGITQELKLSLYCKHLV